MSSTKIIRIPILPLGMVNAHLIAGDSGCILVDAGIPGSERKIAKVLTRHGLSMKDIKLIVVTQRTSIMQVAPHAYGNCRARRSWRIETMPISTAGKYR
jgi:hypothetical protein